MKAYKMLGYPHELHLLPPSLVIFAFTSLRRHETMWTEVVKSGANGSG